jgi:hypothetical protein
METARDAPLGDETDVTEILRGFLQEQFGFESGFSGLLAQAGHVKK